MLYFEDARIEFFGVPLAYVPFMSAPDPTVKRKSGFLFPTISLRPQYGFGIAIPYFWALAPELRPDRLHRHHHAARPAVRGRLAPAPDRGLVLDQGRRHLPGRPGYFANRDGREQPHRSTFRGAIQTAGQFAMNDMWVWGWTGLLMTDTQFLFDYQLSQFTGSFDPFRTGVAAEGVSQLYLTGAGERSYFDIRTIYYYGFSELDNQKQIPIIHPVLDYSNVVAAAGLRRRAQLQVQSHEPHASGRGVQRHHPGRRRSEPMRVQQPSRPHPEQLPAAWHCRHLYARVRRRGLETHPLHEQRPGDHAVPAGARRRGLARGAERAGDVELHHHRTNRARALHAGRRRRISLSVRRRGVVGNADGRADRPAYSAAERDRDRQVPERGRAEPGIQHGQPVLDRQVFRLGPRRGRRPRQRRAAVHRPGEQGRLAHHAVRRILSDVRRELLFGDRSQQHRPGERPRQDDSRTTSAASLISRTRSSRSPPAAVSISRPSRRNASSSRAAPISNAGRCNCCTATTPSSRRSGSSTGARKFLPAPRSK